MFTSIGSGSSEYEMRGLEDTSRGEGLIERELTPKMGLNSPTIDSLYYSNFTFINAEKRNCKHFSFSNCHGPRSHLYSWNFHLDRRETYTKILNFVNFSTKTFFFFIIIFITANISVFSVLNQFSVVVK